jgi:hypothetical protein
MLVVVAVETQQFPVAAVGGVVVVVVVSVVYRQLTEFFPLEFAGTATADVGKKLQRLLPVSGLTVLLFLAHLGDDIVTSFAVRIGHEASRGCFGWKIREDCVDFSRDGVPFLKAHHKPSPAERQ